MLHLIRSAPDEPTTELIEKMIQADQDCVIRLYDENQDWERIIDAIFEYEQTICWW
jgi:hypothetical protein